MATSSQLRPEDVDDFDELLTEALDDFDNPNLLSGAAAMAAGQQAAKAAEKPEAGTAASGSVPSSVDALRENASTADLLKSLAGLSLDSLRAGGGDTGQESTGEEPDYEKLMSRLEADFGQLDKAVQDMLEPAAEGEDDPEVLRLKSELRGFAARVDTTSPAELSETLASTLRSLDESVAAHGRHADAARLPRPSDAAPDGAKDGEEESLMPFMENLMHTLLSKDVIYPSLKAIRDGYPAWLQSHSAGLTPDELEASHQRQSVIGQVCQEYESLGDAKPTDEQFDRLLRLVQRMQALGPPPEELLSDKDLPSVMPQCPQM